MEDERKDANNKQGKSVLPRLLRALQLPIITDRLPFIDQLYSSYSFSLDCMPNVTI